MTISLIQKCVFRVKYKFSDNILHGPKGDFIVFLHYRFPFNAGTAYVWVPRHCGLSVITLQGQEIIRVSLVSFSCTRLGSRSGAATSSSIIISSFLVQYFTYVLPPPPPRVGMRGLYTILCAVCCNV